MKPYMIAFSLSLTCLVSSVFCCSQSHPILETAEDLSKNPRVQCLWLPAEDPTHTVVFNHGFNIQPKKMIPLIDHYRDQGANVVFAILEGHHKNFMSMKQLSGTWMEQAEHCVLQAQEKAPRFNMSFVGFSLGGLVGARLTQEHPHLFKTMELFAPAVVIRRLPLLAKYLFESFIFPTISEIGYTLHSFIPARSYQHIFRMAEDFHNKAKHDGKSSSTDVHIYLHPSDPLISWQGTHKFLNSNKNFKNWIVHDIRKLGKKKNRTKSMIKHMIIDEKTLGRQNWRDVRKALSEHFMIAAKIKR